MDMSRSRQPRLADEFNRERVEQLLGRYPDINLEESGEILRFLKKGPLLEVGLLSSDERLKPRLDRFRSDHARHFALGAQGLVTAAVIIVAIVIVSALLWNLGASH